MLFRPLRKNYLLGSENVNDDDVQDRILQTAGRASRRVVQQKIANDTKSDCSSTPAAVKTSILPLIRPFFACFCLAPFGY